MFTVLNRFLDLKYFFFAQRYYYYIHNGIDTEHVAPMEDIWLEHVLDLVPDELKIGHDVTIENLSDEMREDYLLSVKKAIGNINDFVNLMSSCWKDYFWWS